MKRLVAWLIVLASIGVAIWILLRQPGYFLLAYGSYTVETSLLVFAILLSALLFFGYLFMRFVAFAMRTPERVRAARLRRAIVDGRRDFDSGLNVFLQGKFAEAQRLLGLAAESEPRSSAGFMLAACAAQLNGDFVSVDALLAKAHNNAGKDDRAVSMFEIECLLDQGRFADAKLRLSAERVQHPDDEQALWLEARCLRGLGDQEQLGRLLPSLKASQSLDEEALAEVCAWAEQK